MTPEASAPCSLDTRKSSVSKRRSLSAMSGARTGRSRRLASDAADLVRELARGGGLSELAERVVSGSLAGPSSASHFSLAARQQIRTAAAEIETSALRGSSHVNALGAARTSCRGVGKPPCSFRGSEGLPANAVRRLGEGLRSSYQQSAKQFSAGMLSLASGPRGLGGSVAVRQFLQQVGCQVLLSW